MTLRPSVEPVSQTADWRADAACQGSDPAVFYPEHIEDGGRSVQRAKAICAGCPVAEPCLEWAIAARERFGIFGGRTPRERRVTALRTCQVCAAEFTIAERPGRPQGCCSPACARVARERVVSAAAARRVKRPGRMRELGHGTTTRYVAGCRCKLCRRAVREYQRERRAS